MSMSPQQIVQKQEEILQAMSQFRIMRRGTLSQQTYPERAERKDGKGAVGPYGLWQGTIGGQRFGKRVSGAEAESVKEGIAQRHAFEALCEDYIALGCELASLESEGAALEEAVKKGLKSRSRRAKKSTAS